MSVYCEWMRGRGSRLTRALMTWAGVLAAVLAAAGSYSVAQAQRPGETRGPDRTGGAADGAARRGRRGTPATAVPQRGGPGPREFSPSRAPVPMAEAARETERLQNDLLLGAILADRYLRGRSRPRRSLRAWLTRFGDQAEAPAIRGLLERLAPAAAATRRQPICRRRAAAAVRSAVQPATAVRAEPRCRSGRRRPDARRPTPRRSSSAAWRPCGLARAMPPRCSRPPIAPPRTTALRAAGAFWAARVAQREGDRGKFAVWMRRAALEDDTFYGLIARRALGPAVACVARRDDSATPISKRCWRRRRAAAPSRCSRSARSGSAEAELRTLWMDTAQDGVFDRSIVLAARRGGLHRAGRRDRAQRDAAPGWRDARAAAAGQRLPGRSAAGLCPGPP